MLFLFESIKTKLSRLVTILFLLDVSASTILSRFASTLVRADSARSPVLLSRVIVLVSISRLEFDRPLVRFGSVESCSLSLELLGLSASRSDELMMDHLESSLTSSLTFIPNSRKPKRLAVNTTANNRITQIKNEPTARPITAPVADSELNVSDVLLAIVTGARVGDFVGGAASAG